MEELLRDPVWTFIGAIVAAIAILISLGIYFVQKKKKSLSYEIRTNTQLVGVEDNIEGDIKILFNDKEVKNVHLLVIRITNDGNISILSSDYERNLSFSFDEESTVLSSEITQEEPRGLSVQCRIDGKVVIIKSLLLNAKDCFTVKLLVSDYQALPHINARITGVKAIRKSTEGQIHMLITGVTGMLIMFAGITYSEISTIKMAIAGLVFEAKSLGLLAFFIGYGLLLFGVVRNRYARKAVLNFWRNNF